MVDFKKLIEKNEAIKQRYLKMFPCKTLEDYQDTRRTNRVRKLLRKGLLLE